MKKSELKSLIKEIVKEEKIWKDKYGNEYGEYFPIIMKALEGSILASMEDPELEDQDIFNPEFKDKKKIKSWAQTLAMVVEDALIAKNYIIIKDKNNK